MISKPVKRKIRRKKRHKLKPVDKVLRHCMEILPMLLNGRLGKDKIFSGIRGLNKVGMNDKSDTLAAICHLKKGDLTEEIEDGQYLLQQLTNLGSEIAHLIVLTKEYKKARNRLLEVPREHFDICVEDYHGKELALRSILRTRGWVNKGIEQCDEISYYKHAKYGIAWVMEYSGQILKDGLINRYIGILKQTNSNIGYVARAIIKDLIFNALSYQLQALEKNVHINIGVMDNWNLFEFIQDLGYSYPDFIFNDVKDMMVSDLDILGISNENITKELKSCKDNLKIKPILPDPNILSLMESYGDYPGCRNDKILIAVYEQYLRKLNSS